MNGKIFFLFLLLLLVGAGAWYMYQQRDTEQQIKAIKVPAKHGDFDISVTATGELQAKNSVKVRGPQGIRGMGQVKILDLIKEGTIVKKGDIVAKLDETELDKQKDDHRDRIIDVNVERDQVERDTAIAMSKLRDQIKELKFSIINKEKEVGINIYEPKEVQDRIQSDLEKLQRDYDTALKNYDLEQQKADARVGKVLSERGKVYKKLKEVKSSSKQFTVYAPSDGMVIYERDWRGNKVTTGSTISSWNSVVASLPDLSSMVSNVFVNEIDISRVKIGDRVTIQIDAIPDNEYTGTVIEKGNIGQQRPNFDAKVFEVKIQIDQSDDLLRPAMTSANTILTKSYKDVVYIPLEALHNNEEANYVFMDKDGKTIRQEVITGAYNDAQVIIKYGIEKGEEVHHSIPDNPDDLDLVRLSDDIKQQHEKEQQQERQPAVITPAKPGEVVLPVVEKQKQS